MSKKKSKVLVIILSIVLVLAAWVIFIYPNIEFKKDGKLYACRFSDDFSEFEENSSYNERYFYYEKQDVSLKNFEVKNFLCFYLFSFDYAEGDVRDKEFILEEEYINHWLEAAVIEENEQNLDIAEIIKGKTAIIKNKRYPGNEYDKCIVFELDGKSEIMYVFESGDLTVIQVGSSDELPRFIAYK